MCGNCIVFYHEQTLIMLWSTELPIAHPSENENYSTLCLLALLNPLRKFWQKLLEYLIKFWKLNEFWGMTRIHTRV